MAETPVLISFQSQVRAEYPAARADDQGEEAERRRSLPGIPALLRPQIQVADVLDLVSAPRTRIFKHPYLFLSVGESYFG